MTEHTPTPWQKGTTYSTHNHPSRFWETDVCRWTEDSRGAILLATTSGETKEEAEELAELIAVAVNSHADLVKALEFIRDGYDNQDVNHVDYRVKVYQVAADALAKAGESTRQGNVVTDGAA